MKLLLPLLGSLALVSSVLAAGRHEKGEKPLSISQGAPVNLTDFLVPGKTTVFFFTSEYFQPCRAYAEPLFQLHRQHENLVIVKVDIDRPEVHKVDWDSPVARQYGIQSLPLFRICGPDGKLVADGRPARVMVDRWIRALN